MDTDDNITPTDIRQDIELSKLKLELKKLEIEIAEYNKSNKRDFFIYIVPGLLQFITVLLGALILYLTNFFDVKNELYQIKNEKLELENERLSLRKTELHDTIDSFTKNTKQLEELLKIKQIGYDTLNNKFHNLIRTGDELQGVIREKNIEITKLSNVQYEKIIQNLAGDYYIITTPEVENIINVCRSNEKLKNTIVGLIDDKLNEETKDSFYLQMQNIKLLQLRYFVTNLISDKIAYQATIKEFFNRAKEFNGYYDINILNTLIYNKWSQSEIDENLGILWSYGMNYKDYSKVIQISEWVTYPLMTKDYFVNSNIDYITDAYSIIYNETKFMLDNSNIVMKNYDNTLTYRFLMTMLSTCPQCYFATEIIALRTNMSNVAKQSKISELNFKILYDTTSLQEIPSASVDDPMTTSLLKQNSLLSLPYIQSYSIELKTIHDRFTERYNYPNFRFIQSEDDYQKWQVELEEFYQQHKIAITYWTSKDRIKDFKDIEFRKKILSGTF